jgi:uncharacterized iron-regulated membrane protein
MSAWSQWLQQPQRLWIRRALFQVHLWSGLTLGLYVVMLSLTGSALVYRVELERVFQTPRPAFEPGRPALSTEDMTAAAERAYPGWTVTRVGNRIARRNPVLEVWLEREGEAKKERLFNPYTGADLGDALPLNIQRLDWLAELHGDLLFDEPGALANAAGSALVTLLALSGFVVWWPGIRSWRRGLMVSRKANWLRINWDLHSAMGIWCVILIVIWGISGVYLAYPEPFAALVDQYSDPNAVLGQRPGDRVIRWFTQVHFGRFRNQPFLQALWVPLGLVPAGLFITGGIMWWNRVLRKRSARLIA